MGSFLSWKIWEAGDWLVSERHDWDIKEKVTGLSWATVVCNGPSMEALQCSPSRDSLASRWPVCTLLLFNYHSSRHTDCQLQRWTCNPVFKTANLFSHFLAERSPWQLHLTLSIAVWLSLCRWRSLTSLASGPLRKRGV